MINYIFKKIFPLDTWKCDSAFYGIILFHLWTKWFLRYLLAVGVYCSVLSIGTGSQLENLVFKQYTIWSIFLDYTFTIKTIE